MIQNIGNNSNSRRMKESMKDIEAPEKLSPVSYLRKASCNLSELNDELHNRVGEL